MNKLFRGRRGAVKEVGREWLWGLWRASLGTCSFPGCWALAAKELSLTQQERRSRPLLPWRQGLLPRT